MNLLLVSSAQQSNVKHILPQVQICELRHILDSLINIPYLVDIYHEDGVIASDLSDKSQSLPISLQT